MQAQMIPTLTSIVDHCETRRLSHVGLLEFAKLMSVCRRTILMTVTLRIGNGKSAMNESYLKVLVWSFRFESHTHKVPVKNMIATPIFFFMCS